MQFSNRAAGRGAIDPVTILEAAAGSQPLSGKHIVCLGALRGLSIDDTHKLIEALGGACQQSIDATTDYVVACGGLMLQEASELVGREPKAPAPSAY